MTLSRTEHFFNIAKNNPDRRNLQGLWSLLETATDETGENTAPTVKTELIGMWLSASLMSMQHNDVYEPSLFETIQVMKLISNGEVLQKVLELEENHRVLATICLTVIADAKAGLRNGHVDEVINILTTWTGEAIENNDTLSVEKVTDLLYGPMAYGLYRTDVLSDVELPSYLCRENVKVVAGLKASPAKEPCLAIDVPHDIIGEPPVG